MIDKKKNTNVDIDGWYYDGKKCATLVRDTKYVNVQVEIYLCRTMALLIIVRKFHGRRGKGIKTQVTTTGTKVTNQLTYILCSTISNLGCNCGPLLCCVRAWGGV